MTAELVRVEHAEGLFRITLNRPEKRNALSRALLSELTTAVASVRSADGVRMVVLAANGPVFCAGMDLSEMQATAGQPDSRSIWENDTRIYHDLLLSLFRLQVPTLAVVQGPVLAGGVGLVAACDLVIASESASVSLPEPRRGITAAVVLPLLLHRVGASAASWLLLSGFAWNAEAARQAGFWHEVLPAEALNARAETIVGSVLSGAPGALAVTKQHLQACAAAMIESQLAEGMRFSAWAREMPEAREGLAAFLEKREPNWFVRGNTR